MQLADDPGSIEKSNYTEQLLSLGRNSGLHQVGVASAEVLHRARQALNERKSQGLHNQMQFTYRNPNRSTDPTAALPSAKSVIVGALSYSTQMPEQPEKLSARVARYVWSDYYAQLRESLRQIAKQLESDGFRAVVLADDNAIVDREVAYQAGLGWFGKNSNLLIAGAGSYFVLGCVVTNASLVVAEKPVEDGCGSCRRCLDNCPTQAIIAPGVIDANKCLAWLLQKPGVFDRDFRVALGDRLYGCDDCQLVCPWNKFAKRSSLPDFDERHGLGTATLLQLLQWDEDSFLRLTEGSAIRRIGHARWLRNLAVAAGNALRQTLPNDEGGGLQQAVSDAQANALRQALQRWQDHPSEVVREHIVWALSSLR